MTRSYGQLGPGLRGAFLQSPILCGLPTLKRAPSPGSWSPDGSQIAFFWARDGENQLWVMPAAGGWPVQLTDPPLKIAVDMRNLVDRRFTARPQWSPDGREIAFVARYGDEKDPSLWVVPVAGGEPRRLTHHPGSDRSPQWSPDGKHIAFVCLRDGLDDIWIIPAAGGTPLQLTYDRYDNVDPRWSPDGCLILFSSQRSDVDLFCHDIGIVPVGGGCSRMLTHDARVHDRFPRWTADGQRIVFLSDRSGYDEVWSMTPDGEDARQLTPATGQDKGEFSISSDGQWLAYESTRRCKIDLMVTPIKGGEAVRLSPGDGVSLSPVWSPDGSKVLFNHAAPRLSAELWVSTFANKTTQRLTYTMMGNLRDVELVEPESVQYSSFDGAVIDALLYRPAVVPEGAKYPALILIHGGPNAQHNNGWWPFLQYLMGKGYVILAPNCRGSTGYGRAYMDANLNDWAGRDLQDWAYAVAFLKSLSYIDGDRIGIWGRSYGGYATLMGLAMLPHLFRVGICHFGPTNLVSFWDQTSVRHLMKRLMGLPAENRELLLERSAVPFAQAIQAPVLILQGSADEGVPPTQSEEMVAALKQAGKVYEYKAYEGEGHGFLKVENVMDAADRIEAFLEKYLKG